MAQCRYIDSCTHATGWCNSEKTWKMCEYVSVNNFSQHFKRKDDLMEENKGGYYCAYCGKEYGNPAARANCELSCYQKQVADEEKTRWEQYHKEKQDRENKIKSMRKELSDLEKMFYDDYGEYPISDTYAIETPSLEEDEFVKAMRNIFNKPSPRWLNI
jgi:hypothetical protein